MKQVLYLNQIPKCLWITSFENNFVSNTHIHLVPTPSVTVSTLPMPIVPLYIGESLTLQCQIEISYSVDTPVDVNYTWKNESREVVSSGVTDGTIIVCKYLVVLVCMCL